VCKIGKKEPVFHWLTREGCIYPLTSRTETLSLMAAEDEAGRNGEVILILDNDKVIKFSK
jgi:hypothetical protein